jgi:hypothetical protein
MSEELLEGTQINYLTVISKVVVFNGVRNITKYICSCICYKEILVTKFDLIRKDGNQAKSCGCKRKKILLKEKKSRIKYLISIGDIFDRLEVIGEKQKINGRFKWPVKCSCGSLEIHYVSTSELISGNTKSCGCLAKEHTRTFFKNYRISKGKNPDILLTDNSKLLRSKILQSGILSKVRKRDNYTCQLCGKHSSIKNKLYCHHIIPINLDESRALDIDNLILLCFDCHFTKAHNSNYKTINYEISKRLIHSINDRA